MNDLVPILQRTLYPDAKPESVQLVLDYCAARGLDPMLKPVHLVPMKDSKGVWRDTVMPGIGLYRIMAARSNDYAGMDRPVFEDIAERALGEITLVAPAACTATVYRMVAGTRVAFCATEYWLENYTTRKDGVTPNAMWQKRPFGQLAKCAEAQALRRAWPEVGQQPTMEEVEGRVLDDSDDVPEQVINEVLEAPAGQPGTEEKATGPAPVERDPETVLRDILCSFESCPNIETLQKAGLDVADEVSSLPPGMRKKAQQAYKAQQDKLNRPMGARDMP